MSLKLDKIAFNTSAELRKTLAELHHRKHHQQYSYLALRVLPLYKLSRKQTWL